MREDKLVLGFLEKNPESSVSMIAKHCAEHGMYTGVNHSRVRRQVRSLVAYGVVREYHEGYTFGGANLGYRYTLTSHIRLREAFDKTG